ncbi:trifunctional dihydropteroate synthetase [Rhodosporidiobolus nylandii]
MRDEIRVTDLSLRTPSLAPDHWQRPQKPQPLLLTLSISTDVSGEASADDLLAESLNYGTVTKVVEAHVAGLAGKEDYGDEGIPLEELAEQLAGLILWKASAPNVLLELRRPRAHLRAESVGVRIFRSRTDYTLSPSASSLSSSAKPSPSDYTLRTDSPSLAKDTLFVRQLSRQIIIGLNPCEREDEQEVLVDLEFAADEMNVRLSNGARAGWVGWRGMVKKVEEHLSTSAPLTIEHICTSVAELIVAPPPASPSPPQWNVPRTIVRISKPAALMFARHPGVSVTRTRADFFPSTLPAFRSFSSSSAGAQHTAYLGIGTNLGDRVGNLGDALKKLEELGESAVKVRDTSFLYESEAMYHEEQGKFLNAAVKIETSLSPLSLLNLLKTVESSLGRDFSTFRNGPRVIDLDLLLYDDALFDSREEAGATEQDERWLRVPHLAVQEREFVLRPLADIAPALRHPILQQTPGELLEKVLATSRSTVHRVYPLSRSLVEPFSRPSTSITPSRTLVMSILNATPDSFSDGGDNATVPSAVPSALSHLSSGAHILDIGGMSTRPNAAEVSPGDETARVLPLIRALREEHGVTAPISIDTFRPSVARPAVAAGATMINDVYGGREPGMLAAMAKLGVPVVLMHSRGTPETMTSLTDYSADGGVVAGVRREMEEMVLAALDAGVLRWNILLDPGIGFAKTAAQNYELLRRLPELVGESELLREFPVLIGLSRKRFLGPAKDAKDRVMETAAGITSCVASGVCEVVRVHDAKEMADAVRVADAIYRQ